MFWKVPGFSQPSPVEQILDKEDFTLEELLDEDDIIQECKSLNARLIAFLRERSTVEQLIRYLVEPQDSDDPKRTYKYPFTSCEVLCCESEAVYSTLLEDPQLMKLLFSLLDAPSPLSCKTAGYFGRVVGNLLLRKSVEMLQYLQGEGTGLLEKLVKHVDTTSIADVIKRLVGADDQNSLMLSPAMAEWLADTPLVELLLERLAASHSPEAQANAADILSATAHTQPSPLAGKLTEHASIAVLVEHALAPGRQVLVSALDVCIALLEPRRAALHASLASQLAAQLGDAAAAVDAAPSEAAKVAKSEAVTAIVQHLPRLVELLSLSNSTNTQQTPCGLLKPPLGRHRLKVVELLAVLVRSGCEAAETAVIQGTAMMQCLELFSIFTFNNLLHHNITAMLVACMSSSSDAMIRHLFEECKVLDWIVGLPLTVVPIPNPGNEEIAAAKAPLRAGYLGHVMHIAGVLESLAQGAPTGSMGDDKPAESKVAKYTEAHEGWNRYLEEVLHPQQAIENTANWQCGRPAVQAIGAMDSDGDDFSHEMDLEQISGLQQPLYHRYSSEENEDDEGDDDDADEAAGEEFKTGTYDFGAEMITEAVQGMDINLMYLGPGNSSEDTFRADNADLLTKLKRNDMGMDDDEVLLANSDEEFPESSTPESGKSPLPAGSSPGPVSHSREGPDDMVIADEEDSRQVGETSQRNAAALAHQALQQHGAGPQQATESGSAGSSSAIEKTGVWQGATWCVDVSDEES